MEPNFAGKRDGQLITANGSVWRWNKALSQWVWVMTAGV